MFEIIDELSPAFPVYLARYGYGKMVGDADYFYFPKEANMDPISAKDPPYFFLLDKKLEIYLEYQNKILPNAVYTPGLLSPQSYELSRYKEITLKPDAIFYLTAGVRNVHVMSLQQKGDAYRKLARHFKLDSGLSPENLQHHYAILSRISDAINSDWQCSLLIFDKQWKQHIFNNPKWYKLKEYILLQSIKINAAQRNSFFLEHAISNIAKARDLKNKPFSEKMIKYLLYIALGEISGMRPAIDDSGLPVKELMDVLSVYHPTTIPMIIEPHDYNPITERQPIYHSLPATTFNLSEPKTFRPLTYLNEIADSLDIYLREFKNHPFTQGTVFENLYKAIKINYYSVLGDARVKKAADLLEDDKRFYDLHKEFEYKTQYGFAKRSVFTKALISIETDISQLNNT